MPRRDAILGGLGAIGAVSMIWVAPRSALAASDKVSKAAVQYTDTGNVRGKDCDDCSQFVPGKTAKDSGTCKIVEGAISPHGHCIAFTPKPKS
ncbi:MAG TPA: hypothetical protein VGI48_08070 [Caldimonas sp.]|jgi:hypothetical protein